VAGEGIIKIWLHPRTQSDKSFATRHIVGRSLPEVTVGWSSKKRTLAHPFGSVSHLIKAFCALETNAKVSSDVLQPLKTIFLMNTKKYGNATSVF
jgi:hypothetical protein